MGCSICRFHKENFAENEYEFPQDKLKSENNILNNNILSSVLIKNDNNMDNLTDVNPNITTPQNNILKCNKKEVEIKNLDNLNNNFFKNDKNNIEIINNEFLSEKNINQIPDEIKGSISSSSRNDYNTRIIDLINKVRLNPFLYSKIILENIQFISKNYKMETNEETGQNEEKEIIIYQNKVKVRLNKGSKAFINAAESLKNIKSMNELIIKNEIKLDVPKNENELNDNSFFKKQLIQINNKHNISAFFKDNIKNPEVGLLLMIVGDYFKGGNKKRNTILNPEYKYIAVNSNFIAGQFISLFTFSK